MTLSGGAIAAIVLAVLFVIGVLIYRARAYRQRRAARFRAAPGLLKQHIRDNDELWQGAVFN